MSKELVKQDTKQESVILYSHSEEKLKVLAAKSSEITTAKGASYKLVMAALSELRAVRVDIEKERKAKKAQIIIDGRNIDGKAKELTAITETEENRLKLLRKEVDDEKARIEQDRIDSIQKRIDAIKEMSAEEIESLLLDDSYQEFYGAAQQAVSERRNELNRLAEIEAERVRAEKAKRQQEEEAERLRIEREALEKEKAAQAERERVEQEKINKEREAQALERKKIDDERRTIEQEKERQRIEAEAKKQARLELEAKEKEAARKKSAALAALPDAEKASAYIANLLEVPVPSCDDQYITDFCNAMRKQVVAGQSKLEKIRLKINEAAA